MCHHSKILTRLFFNSLPHCCSLIFAAWLVVHPHSPQHPLSLCLALWYQQGSHPYDSKVAGDEVLNKVYHTLRRKSGGIHIAVGFFSAQYLASSFSASRVANVTRDWPTTTLWMSVGTRPERISYRKYGTKCSGSTNILLAESDWFHCTQRLSVFPRILTISMISVTMIRLETVFSVGIKEEL